MQEVEWFASRRLDIAMQQRASDRARMIQQLKDRGDPLAAEYDRARLASEEAVAVARESGDYPLLSGGDINIYSLFVERGLSLISPEGRLGFVTPVGIATDKTAARFFSWVTEEQRLPVLYVFENRGGWLFRAVHHEEKPTVIVISGSNRPQADTDCAFFIQNFAQLADSTHRLSLDTTNYKPVNVNTGTAPLFRNARDAKIVSCIYGRLPVLVDYSKGHPRRTYPVRYKTLFHMTAPLRAI